MMVMTANHASMLLGYIAGSYKGRIGWIISPDHWKTPPKWMPYAFDNGAFPMWEKGREWKEGPFYAHCDRIYGQPHKPLWIAVPDVVGNKDGTICKWNVNWQRVATYGCPLAFVVQDKMTPDDVPKEANVIFVGGTTEWKWRNLTTWTKNFPVVHVGRANTERMLWMCHEAGAVSCDGTGWFRDPERHEGLLRYLEESTTGKQQTEMCLSPDVTSTSGDSVSNLTNP